MTTSILSVSKKNLSCETIMDLLYNMKTPASVTQNNTIICSKDTNPTTQKCWFETGCRITFTDENITKSEIKKVWTRLQEKLNFRCAHIKRDAIFSGCIHDYIQKTKCPGGTE